MDNDKLDRIVLLLEHMDKRLDKLEQGQERIEKHLEKHTEQLAAIIENVNTFNRELNSKITTIDKKVNITAVDILELRAAK